MVAAVAATLPAWRASRIVPVTAVKAEWRLDIAPPVGTSGVASVSLIPSWFLRARHRGASDRWLWLPAPEVTP
jgi:hypothetical protein